MQQSIKKIILQGESQKMEFKTSLSLRNEIGETISAFTNTSGGVIFIGVSDKGKSIGIDIGKNTLEDLANWVKQNTDPAIYPDIKVYQINSRSIIKVSIKENDDKPVFFKDRAFQRVGKTNQRILASKIRELAKQEKKKFHWDERICERAILKDIDEEKVTWFLKKAKAKRNLKLDPDISIKETLEKLELTINGRLTNAAVLLFGKDPQKFFLQAETRCGRFKGTKPTKPFIDMKVFGGNVIDQVAQAEDFVLRHTSMAAWVEQGKLERQEKWEYPPDAIREAIVNAICHRDYEMSSNVQLRIFDDRIEIWGCGSLPEPLTVADLKRKHRSILRNPLIGKCFFLIKFIEEWGTGTNEIIGICADWGLPEPLFEEITGGLVVTFRKSKLTEEDLEKMELNYRQEKIIDYLREHKTITSTRYAEMFNITKRTARSDLVDLIRKGIVSAKGEAKKERFYVLTEI